MARFTFNVPHVGTVRVVAKDLRDALMEIADVAGIQMVRAQVTPRVPNLRLVKSKSPVSNPSPGVQTSTIDNTTGDQK